MALKPEYSEPIIKQEVQLSAADDGKLAFILHNIISKKECDNLIKESKNIGYKPAVVKVPDGRQLLMPEVRNNQTCVIESQEYASILWQRIKDFIPDVFNDKPVVGLNERFRFLRYDPGQFFKPHVDGCSKRENGEKSFITFQLYLNEGFKGGCTTFLGEANEVFPVVPKAGSVLIFQHNIGHEGSVLEKGRKYTVRSDIMYGPLKK